MRAVERLSVGRNLRAKLPRALRRRALLDLLQVLLEAVHLLLELLRAGHAPRVDRTPSNNQIYNQIYRLGPLPQKLPHVSARKMKVFFRFIIMDIKSLV